MKVAGDMATLSMLQGTCVRAPDAQFASVRNLKERFFFKKKTKTKKLNLTPT